MKVDTHALLDAYIRMFNQEDEETIVQAVPNAAALDWLEARIPRVALPDAAIERAYYFRWWTYRKHLKQTPEGFVVTEFLPPVSWAGKYNTISCAAGHHIREGRWLRENAFLDDYIHFWYNGGKMHLRSYSNWLESAIESLATLRGDETGLDLLDAFVHNLRAWEAEHMCASGLYWSSDNRDGCEFSISGPGLRPTLNCYQYANLIALGNMADRKKAPALRDMAQNAAQTLRNKINALLWDDDLGFYVTLPQRNASSPPFSDPLRHVREIFGYAPWMFGVADPGHSAAFRQLIDFDGFRGTYGLLSAERRHPCFGLFYSGEALNAWRELRGEPPVHPLGHECLWNGPSWPYASSIALTALANLLSGGEAQETIHAIDYCFLLSQYAASHTRRTECGKMLSWLDENLNPDTGDWISRTCLMHWGGQCFPAEKGGYERGKDYNHSSFCDLVLEGLFGIRPQWDCLRICPLFPAEWPYALVEDVRVHGRNLSIYYQSGKYQVLLDGHPVYTDARPTPCTISWH